MQPLATSGGESNFLHMAVLKVLSGVLSASSAGLALAERIAAPAPASDGQDVVKQPSVENWSLDCPSQSESAALLDETLGRAREKARLAAY